MGPCCRVIGRRPKIAYGAPILRHQAFGGRRPSVYELGTEMANRLRASKAGPTVIASHSVGVFVGLAIAHGLPDRVSGLVAVNGGLSTVARFIDSPLAEMRQHPRECLGFLRLFALVSAPIPRVVKRWVASSPKATRLVVGDLVSDSALASIQQRRDLIAEAGTTETLLALRDNRHHWPEFAGYASEVQVPVRFVAGDRDPMTTIRDTRQMVAMLPNAAVEVLAGVGHAAPIEATSPVVRAITRLLPTEGPPIQ